MKCSSIGNAAGAVASLATGSGWKTGGGALRCDVFGSAAACATALAAIARAIKTSLLGNGGYNVPTTPLAIGTSSAHAAGDDASEAALHRAIGSSDATELAKAIGSVLDAAPLEATPLEVMATCPELGMSRTGGTYSIPAVCAAARSECS